MLLNRRGAGGEDTGENRWNLIGGCELDEVVRYQRDRNELDCCFTSLSRGAHPGTEHRAVRGFLMVRMLGFVGDRLGGGQSADHEDAEHQETGESTLDQY